MKTIKIYFTCSWGDSTEDIVQRYSLYTPGGSGNWENLSATTQIEHADFVIVLDGIPKEENCSSLIWRILSRNTNKNQSLINKIKGKKVIFLQREPLEIKPTKLPMKCVFEGTYQNHYHASTWMIKKSFNELSNLSRPESPKLMSAVVSGKTNTVAQKKRLEVVQKIVKSGLDIDIYGKGLSFEDFGHSYKGPLVSNGFCKFLGLYDYRYTVAIENSKHENYFTEKIVDAFLSWSKPLYWGCPNINKFFPKDSFVQIDIFDPNVVEKIREEIQKPIDYESLREARELVLKRYNIWPSLHEIIKEV